MNGNWQQLTLDAPLHLLAGDVTVVVANVLQVWRDGVLIETRAMTPGPAVEPTPVASDRVISELFIFKEPKMPGQNVALTRVQLNQSTGAVTFSFSNGNNREYGSVEDAKNASEIADMDTTGALAENALILKTFRNSPDGTNLENMVGGSVAINFNADVPFIMTNPE